MARSDAPQTDFGRISRLEGDPLASLLGDPRLVASPIDHAEIARLGLSVFDTGALPAPLYMLAAQRTVGAADSTLTAVVPAAVTWRLKAASVRAYNPNVAPANLIDLSNADFRILAPRDIDYPATLPGGWTRVTAPGNDHAVSLAGMVAMAGAVPRAVLAWSGDVVVHGGSTVVIQTHGSAAGDVILVGLLFNRIIGPRSRPPR